MEWKQKEQELTKKIEETENSIRAQEIVTMEVLERVTSAQHALRTVLDEQQREEKKLGEYKTLVANLKNELGHGQQMHQQLTNSGDADFDGCPKEWQREVIVFMRKQPGVPIHFTALITHVTQKMEMDAYTKMRAAMLNLMGYLITKKLVTKGKQGNYTWAVFPEGWKTPAPVIPINLKAIMDRVPIAEKFVESLKSGNEFIQKDLEKTFHKKCIEANLSLDNPDDFKNDAQFIERYIYERAQRDGGILNVYENAANRQTGEASTHLIIARARLAQPSGEWVLVPNPAFRQPAIDTKRKGGSVA